MKVFDTLFINFQTSSDNLLMKSPFCITFLNSIRIATYNKSFLVLAK